MKLEIRILLLLLVVSLGACAPTQYTTKNYQDDLYYIPSVEPINNTTRSTQQQNNELIQESNNQNAQISPIPTPKVSDADIYDTSDQIDYKNYSWVASDTIDNGAGSPIIQNFYFPDSNNWDYMNRNSYSNFSVSFGWGYDYYWGVNPYRYHPYHYYHSGYYDPMDYYYSGYYPYGYNSLFYYSGYPNYYHPYYHYHPAIIVGGGGSSYHSQEIIRGGRMRSSGYQSRNTSRPLNSNVISGTRSYGRQSGIDRSRRSTTTYRPTGTQTGRAANSYRSSSSNSYPKYKSQSRSSSQQYYRPRSNKVSGYRSNYNSNVNRNSYNQNRSTPTNTRKTNYQRTPTRSNSYPTYNKSNNNPNRNSNYNPNRSSSPTRSSTPTRRSSSGSGRGRQR